MATNPRQIWAYFGLTYLITWGLMGPWVYLFHNRMDGHFPWWFILMGLAGAYGPTIAALAVTAFTEGAGGVRRLVAKVLVWRVGLQWYAFIVLYPMCVVMLSLLAYGLFGGELGRFAPQLSLSTFLPAVMFALPFGPMAEELGWRGHALPRLQQHFSPLVSSLILGAMWTFWHGPLFWFPGAALPSAAPIGIVSIGLYLVHTVSLTIVFTWVFNHTQGSVLIAILFHAFSNAGGTIVTAAFPDLTSEQMMRVDWIGVVPAALAALVIVVRFGLRAPASVPSESTVAA